jgi:hypothetical protein
MAGNVGGFFLNFCHPHVIVLWVGDIEGGRMEIELVA